MGPGNDRAPRAGKAGPAGTGVQKHQPQDNQPRDNQPQQHQPVAAVEERAGPRPQAVHPDATRGGEDFAGVGGSTGAGAEAAHNYDYDDVVEATFPASDPPATMAAPRLSVPAVFLERDRARPPAGEPGGAPGAGAARPAPVEEGGRAPDRGGS